MSDFPVDEELAFPISPGSSILDALCALHPSPSPAPSKLAFTWSSGDIPVILYDDAYTDSHSSVSILCAGRNKRESTVMSGPQESIYRSAYPSPRVSTGSKASLLRRDRDSIMSMTLSSSGSSDTICSAATFGHCQGECTGVALPNVPKGNIPLPLSRSTISEDHGTGEADNRFSRGHRGYKTRDSQRSRPEELSSISQGSTASGESTLVELPCSATITSLVVERDENTIAFDTPTTKRTHNAQSWISEWNYKQDSDLAMGLPGGAINEKEDSVPRSPSPTNRLEIERLQPDLQIMVPSPSRASEQNSEEHIHNTSIRGATTDISWLSDTTVQFLIDQEGFRDAEPSFRFAGMLRIRPSEAASERIMAQFRPVSRQQFHFHHAPFESPPVLRRITVNNDDTSDYVSRQGHLPLKSNGVFVLHGHETFLASDSLKLYWQFEYLVDDRRVDVSGSKRNLEGEKTFTPLTFSCSPELFLPAQAKRINIMHVFKKSVAPKLVAERLQPPAAAVRVRSGGRSPKSLEKNFNAHLPHQLQGENTHRPTSQGILDSGDDGQSRRAVSDHICNPISAKPQIREGNTKHRRASSAGEHLPPSRHGRYEPKSVKERITPDPSNPQRGPSTAGRHIVPPARLSELLIRGSPTTENSASISMAPEISNQTTMIETPDHDDKTFVALSPRPKRMVSH